MDFENDHQFEVMASTALKGKAPDGFNWAAYYKTFRRIVLTPRQLANLVQRGYATTPVWHTARREENFISAQHMAFDFDTGDETSSLDYLMRDGTFAWLFASFGYTTPSHTPEAPRSRLVFVLEYPIYDPAEYRAAYQAVALKIAQDGSYCDPACKDSLRLYYGSPHCTGVGNWSVLGTAALELAQKEHEKVRPVVVAQPARVKVERPSDNMKAAKLQWGGRVIAGAPQGERHTVLLKTAHTLGGYVAGAGIAESDVIAELMAASAAWGDDRERERIIRDGITSGVDRPLYFEVKQSAGSMLP